MKISTKTTVSFLWVVAALIAGSSIASAQEKNTLKEALKDKFLIGTAVNTQQASGKDKVGAEVIRKQFNAICCIRREKQFDGYGTYLDMAHSTFPLVLRG